MDQSPSSFNDLLEIMRNEFMAVVERAGGKHIAHCPEIPEAKGEGRTKMGALVALRVAVVQILDDRRERAVRCASQEAMFETITIA
jgi:hypothetical protein